MSLRSSAGAVAISSASFLLSPKYTLRLYRIAKEEGCKFYCASDSHTVKDYDKVEEVLPKVIAALGLEEEDRYLIP